jgi:hypothetical protein
MNPELAQLARRIEKRIDRVHRLIARKSFEVTTLQSKINFLVRQQEALSERIYYLENPKTEEDTDDDNLNPED